MAGLRAVAASIGAGAAVALCSAGAAVADTEVPDKPAATQSSRQIAPDTQRRAPREAPQQARVATQRLASRPDRPHSRAGDVPLPRPRSAATSRPAAVAQVGRSALAASAESSPAAAPTLLSGLAAAIFNQTPALQPTVTGLSGRVVTGRLNATDPDTASLSYTVTRAPTQGAVVVAVDGTYTYTASPTAVAGTVDSFEVGVSDAAGGFHIHGLMGLLNLLTFGLLGAAGHEATTTVSVPVGGETVPAGGPFDPGARLVAFPGAEGFGAFATGGRGGNVLYVTNLNADGPGSLQWAIDQPGPKYILFKVSGLIDAQIHLTNGDVTIAGQTSPGGITVRGFITDETPFQDQAVQTPADYAQNWILQDVRLRPGPGGPSDDGLRIRYTRNAIVDHVSIGNATDEAIEISFSHDITVQNTLISETVGGHSFYGGVLMNYSNPANGFGLDNIALHHNVFNRIEGRLPEGSRESAAAANSTMNLELSDNLYWDPRFFVALAPNTGVATNPSGDPYPIYWRINAVNNYFRTGEGFQYGMFDDQIMRTARNQLYVSGNQMSRYPGLSDYQLFYCCDDFASLSADDRAAFVAGQLAQKLPSRLAFPSITYTPTGALRTTLLNTVGTWPRDPMDIRLLGFVAGNTISPAPIGTNPAGDALLPAYVGSPPAPPTDTDNDGMPDAWEISKGLDPNVPNANATVLSPAGYTDLEVYLHELMAGRITGWP